MSEAGRTIRMKPTEAELAKALQRDWKTVAGFLREHPQFILQDDALLLELGLWRKPENVVEFGPAALAKLSEAKSREAMARLEEAQARQALEETAMANFAAQAQTHAAVVDLLEARNHADLARRIDEIAQLRFGLVSGVIALEGPERVPAGWRALEEGQADDLLSPNGLSRMGQSPYAELMFGQLTETIRSVAMVRIAIWSPARQAVLAFGSPDPDGFTDEMGAELVAFLGRVVERTAERWPVI
jgi:uncharacterized protein YigA (DUF484 family)